MLTFRVRNTRVVLRFGFFAVWAAVLCLENSGELLPVFLAYTLHEAGHITAAYLCAMPVECVSFSSLGVRISGRSEGVSYLRRAAVSLAGPLTNLLFFLLFLPLSKPYYAVQLVLFLFHILPAVPLDGGTALYCALCCVYEERTAASISLVLSAVLAFLLGVLGFSMLLRSNGNFTLLFAAGYILVYIAQKQRGDLC